MAMIRPYDQIARFATTTESKLLLRFEADYELRIGPGQQSLTVYRNGLSIGNAISQLDNPSILTRIFEFQDDSVPLGVNNYSAQVIDPSQSNGPLSANWRITRIAAAPPPPPPPAPSGLYILMETGDPILLETGDPIYLETATP
jgi:hypothetical protein